MSLRKLKYHEQKLLKKVDFLQWKSDQVRRSRNHSKRCSHSPSPSLTSLFAVLFASARSLRMCARYASSGATTYSARRTTPSQQPHTPASAVSCQ